jgi:hypothetical protein
VAALPRRVTGKDRRRTSYSGRPAIGAGGHRATLAIRERLTKTDSGNAGWQSDLSVSQGKVGDVLLAQGHLPAALESLHNALVIRERLAQAALEMPCRSTTCFLERLAQNDPANAEWHRDVALSHGRVATVRARLVVSSSRAPR